MIVPQVEVGTLAVIAERIRAGIEALPAPPNGATLTISVGASLYPTDGRTAEQLFHAADERLYARQIVRGEWEPTPASAGLVDDLRQLRSQ